MQPIVESPMPKSCKRWPYSGWNKQCRHHFFCNQCEGPVHIKCCNNGIQKHKFWENTSNFTSCAGGIWALCAWFSTAPNISISLAERYNNEAGPHGVLPNCLVFSLPIFCLFTNLFREANKFVSML